MQVLDVQPTNPTPYTPVGGSYNNNPVPGAGGLPSLSGLTRNMNPMAQQLQQQGRGEDSVLVHMTPGEVNSLRGLAQQFGGDLTTNPNTGLPEAGWLGKLLPTILGAVGMAFGIPPIWMGLGGAAVGTAVTGDLGKGLSMGLQAYGGASLGGAAGIGGKLGHVGSSLGLSGSSAAVMHPVASAAGAGAGATGAVAPAFTVPVDGGAMNLGALGGKAAGATSGMGGFGAAAKAGLGSGLLSKAAVPLAVSGALGGISSATQPSMPKYDPNAEKNTMPYEGPYRPMPRRLHQTVTGPGEIQYFDEVNPIGYLTASGERRGYAEGGEADDDNRARAAKMIESGYVDPKTGVLSTLASNPGAYGIPAGSVSDLGGLSFRVNDKGGWEYAGLVPSGAPTPAAPAAPAAPPPPPPQLTQPPSTLRVTGINPDMGGVTPGTGVPASGSDFKFSPGTTQSGYGVERLADTYTPQFTSKADYVTPKNPAYTLGSQLAAQLPAYANMFQTSPGPITASRTYPGGSPSERIRAAAQANAASAPRTSNEVDYGFAKSAGLTPTMSNAAVADWNSLMAQYGFSPNNIITAAKGGEIHMDDGSFVVDARTVSELGNGSSNAGIELLERLGGHAVRGPGDGVSDSVPANIGGRQEARVARDEVIFPAATVKRLGGAKKLYALMDKAHKARKKAGRGEDTGLRKGLA